MEGGNLFPIVCAFYLPWMQCVPFHSHIHSLGRMPIRPLPLPCCETPVVSVCNSGGVWLVQKAPVGAPCCRACHNAHAWWHGDGCEFASAYSPSVLVLLRAMPFCLRRSAACSPPVIGIPACLPRYRCTILYPEVVYVQFLVVQLVVCCSFCLCCAFIGLRIHILCPFPKP